MHPALVCFAFPIQLFSPIEIRGTKIIVTFAFSMIRFF